MTVRTVTVNRKDIINPKLTVTPSRVEIKASDDVTIVPTLVFLAQQIGAELVGEDLSFRGIFRQRGNGDIAIAMRSGKIGRESRKEHYFRFTSEGLLVSRAKEAEHYEEEQHEAASGIRNP
jgi:hypothetical protein